MGFWIPDLNVGFTCAVDGDVMRDKIFFWEALCVLGAIQWYTESGLTFLATPECPVRLAVFTDNSNTVCIFDSLHALPEYNPILRAAVDLRVKHNIDLRVLHISGEDNFMADALSRENFDFVHAHSSNMVITPFSPPRTMLGAVKK
ncbi:hypothetical protein BDZ89DRAFT_959561 [Hymenopellis radicata]|nr:hypothetical protein BDZ89DRAFT_959561 [Hymenopellis radicata]